MYDRLVKYDIDKFPSDKFVSFISLAHDKKYVNKLEKTLIKYNRISLSTDCKIWNGMNTLQSINASVMSVIKAVDVVMEENDKKVFCNIRPPGHHAYADKSSGFCFVNNVAIAVRYALQNPEIQRVSILDWDIHRGDGTQSIFKNDTNIQYCSLHNSPPFYPGTYEVENDNHCLVDVCGKQETNDNYMKHYKKILERIRIFKPDLIFISCGFDCHQDDLYDFPVGDNETEQMTEMICKLSNEVCNGKIISVLEGGYDLNTLKRCAYLHVETLLRHEE